MSESTIDLGRIPENRKLYFASDFHLGSPNLKESQLREKRIVAWLDEIKKDAHAVFLLGDIFDFWFEYTHVIPKGFVRLLGKLAELSDDGIPLYIFTGNHDMWMFDYFEKEIGVKIIRSTIDLKVNDKKLFLGHGDGLGPGDRTYKLIKAFFSNKFCQGLFSILPPRIGFGIAQDWSSKSRRKNVKKDKEFLGEKEFLIQYVKTVEESQHHDYYIFGHRHLPLEIRIGNQSKYINLGEWINHNSYAVFAENKVDLLYYSTSDK